MCEDVNCMKYDMWDYYDNVKKCVKFCGILVVGALKFRKWHFLLSHC